jgi:hypothetical protein
MVKKINWLLIAVMTVLMFSCAKDDIAPIDTNGMVEFTVSTAIPQTITTYASHNGGATNVDADKFNLRYILEVWTKETPRRLAYRAYKIVNDNFTTQGVTFSARLLAMEYDFVFWADFVDEDVTEADAADADYWYKTNDGETEDDIKANPTAYPGLKGIELNFTMTGGYAISAETRDAFYAVRYVDLRTTNVLGSVNLYRPFGKFRLVSLDAVDGYLNGITIEQSKLQYTGTTTFPAGFNALTGEVNTAVTVDLSAAFSSDVATENAEVGGQTYTDARILAFDYIFAAPAQTASFNISVYDDHYATNQIGETKAISNIPIVANKLTTIIGYFFTNGADFDVIVSDPFEEIVIDMEEEITVVSSTNADKGSFDNIAAAVAAANAAGDTINVPAGTFDLPATGITLTAGVTLKGAGKDVTILRHTLSSPYNNGAAVTAVSLQNAGTVLDGVWVMYDTDRQPGTTWSNYNPLGVNFAHAGVNSKLINSRVSGFRIGVYANNTKNITVESNELLKNRYNIQFVNTADEVIKNNLIKEAETIGIYFIRSNSNTTGAAPVIENNTFTGNWFSDIGISHDFNRPLGNIVDGNTFVDSPPLTVKVATPSLPSASGTFTKNFQANIVTNKLDELTLPSEYTLWNTVNIDNTYYSSIADAVTAASAGDVINISAGIFNTDATITLDKAITVKGTGFASKIETDLVTPVFNITAAATIDGIFIEKTNKDNQNIIHIASANVTVKNSKFVGRYAWWDETEVVRGITMNAGTTDFEISGNHFEALRQPGYIEGNGTVKDNYVTGTRGWVVTENSQTQFTNNFVGYDWYNWVDIAIIDNNVTATGYYDDVVGISTANNGAHVENQVAQKRARFGEEIDY